MIVMNLFCVDFSFCALATATVQPAGATATINLSSPLETLAWNPHQPSHIAVRSDKPGVDMRSAEASDFATSLFVPQIGSKDGALAYYDVRHASAPVWRVESQSAEATSCASFRCRAWSCTLSSRKRTCFRCLLL